ncbi:MAG: DinB family protein [Fimbriimonadaceae bacterium]|nr:DinB family protein [Fimbriimonadaceae bacterium]
MNDFVTQCKDRASNAMEMFLRNLGHVPEGKLRWSPSPTAKCALQIAAHVAAFSGAFASILRAGAFPPTAEEFLAPIVEAMEGIETVEQAEAMLRQGIAETLAALDMVRPELIESSIETPIGVTPFVFFMTIPSVHLVLHTGQIDYLQTCWGDQEIYF